MSSSGASKSGPGGPSTPPLHREISADDTRRMAPIYIGVIIVEILTLLAIWWFQEHFS